MQYLVVLEEKEIKNDIISIYDTIADKLDKTEYFCYDVKHIRCTTKAFELIKELYEEQHFNGSTFAMVWLNYGAKADIESDTIAFLIDDKFFNKEKI